MVGFLFSVILSNLEHFPHLDQYFLALPRFNRSKYSGHLISEGDWLQDPCACSVTQLYLILWDPTDCSIQVPLSVAFSSQEYWKEFSFPTPGDLPDPVIQLEFLVVLALTGGLDTEIQG